VGHFGLIAAMQRAQASALQPFSYSMVVWALILGWLAFGERPDVWTVSGIIAIVLAGLYAMHRERRQSRR
jgi:drug/metabolite transporter (DMT)-like permease